MDRRGPGPRQGGQHLRRQEVAGGVIESLDRQRSGPTVRAAGVGDPGGGLHDGVEAGPVPPAPDLTPGREGDEDGGGRAPEVLGAQTRAASAPGR